MNEARPGLCCASRAITRRRDESNRLLLGSLGAGIYRHRSSSAQLRQRIYFWTKRTIAAKLSRLLIKKLQKKALANKET
jgi:hypothetical protein